MDEGTEGTLFPSLVPNAPKPTYGTRGTFSSHPMCSNEDRGPALPTCADTFRRRLSDGESSDPPSSRSLS